MGSGGAKETNRQLAEQRNAANAVANTMGGRGNEQYGKQEDVRDYLLNEYKGLYGGIGERSMGGGGGGGGPALPALNFESEALPFYMKMMNEGGYSEADKANILSYATGPISGMFEGLKRQLQSAGAGRGLPSYGGTIGRLAQDQAYQSGEMAKGVAGDLAERVLRSRFQGAEGTKGIESEKRAFQERQRQQQINQRNARAGRAAADQKYRDQMELEYLGRIQGLMPSDLPYVDRQMGALGLGTQAATSRANETPMWQRALTSAIPAAASAATGAFSFGGGRNKRGQKAQNVWE